MNNNYFWHFKQKIPGKITFQSLVFWPYKTKTLEMMTSSFFGGHVLNIFTKMFADEFCINLHKFHVK